MPPAPPTGTPGCDPPDADSVDAVELAEFPGGVGECLDDRAGRGWDVPAVPAGREGWR